jgi:hypothetical protein
MAMSSFEAASAPVQPEFSYHGLRQAHGGDDDLSYSYSYYSNPACAPAPYSPSLCTEAGSTDGYRLTENTERWLGGSQAGLPHGHGLGIGCDERDFAGLGTQFGDKWC